MLLPCSCRVGGSARIAVCVTRSACNSACVAHPHHEGRQMRTASYSNVYGTQRGENKTKFQLNFLHGERSSDASRRGSCLRKYRNVCYNTGWGLRQ